MRLIGNFSSEESARRFALLLEQQGIENSCDVSFDAPSGHISYQIWVHNEDRLGEAEATYLEFMAPPSMQAALTPSPTALQAAVSQPSEASSRVKERAKAKFPFTIFVIAFCSMVYLLNLFEEAQLVSQGVPPEAVLTPTQLLLLFDAPPAMEKIQDLLEQLPPPGKGQEISPALQQEILALEAAPYWRGVYTWALLSAQGKSTAAAQGPLFEDIRQGQVWRLFSPAILHGNFLHILFNMIWVWILCRPIEVRLGIFRTLLLTLVVGILANVVQYLMSGPLFIGYSGIVMGLAGFTWMRERIAPWEGYPLHRMVMLFLLLFIGGMFLLQSTAFLLQIFTKIAFEPNIANTAHIFGGLLGAWLGRFSFFSARVFR